MGLQRERGLAVGERVVGGEGAAAGEGVAAEQERGFLQEFGIRNLTQKMLPTFS